jgi:hypothetical protein
MIGAGIYGAQPWADFRCWLLAAVPAFQIDFRNSVNLRHTVIGIRPVRIIPIYWDVVT